MNGGWRGEKNINTDQSYQEQFKRDEWIKQKALFRNLCNFIWEVLRLVSVLTCYDAGFNKVQQLQQRLQINNIKGSAANMHHLLLNSKTSKERFALRNGQLYMLERHRCIQDELMYSRESWI